MPRRRRDIVVACGKGCWEGRVEGGAAVVGGGGGMSTFSGATDDFLGRLAGWEERESRCLGRQRRTCSCARRPRSRQRPARTARMRDARNRPGRGGGSSNTTIAAADSRGVAEAENETPYSSTYLRSTSAALSLAESCSANNDPPAAPIRPCAQTAADWPVAIATTPDWDSTQQLRRTRLVTRDTSAAGNVAACPPPTQRLPQRRASPEAVQATLPYIHPRARRCSQRSRSPSLLEPRHPPI